MSIDKATALASEDRPMDEIHNAAAGGRPSTLGRETWTAPPRPCSPSPREQRAAQSVPRLASRWQDARLRTSTGTIYQIDPDTGRASVLHENLGRVASLAWSADGKLLAVGLAGERSEIRIWSGEG